MVRHHLSCGRRDEGEGRNRITRKGRIAGSRHDKLLAEKALYAKTQFKLTLVGDPVYLAGPRAHLLTLRDRVHTCAPYLAHLHLAPGRP